MTVPTVTTGTLAAPGVRLYYEVRGSGPLIALAGAPMQADMFASLATALADDHTVLTMDPRGHGRSVLDDPATDSTPELRAGDLARLLRHLGEGPATVFGSSGGAITGLALVQQDSSLVSTLVAHEPPLTPLLCAEDRAAQAVKQADIVETYRRGDEVEAIRKFFESADMHLPEPVFQQIVGSRDEAQRADDAYFYLHELPGTAEWTPDTEALRAAPTRLILGVGASSAGQFCDRTTRALGQHLGLEPVVFPGGHGGFTEDPAGFAARLRSALGG